MIKRIDIIKAVDSVIDAKWLIKTGSSVYNWGNDKALRHAVVNLDDLLDKLFVLHGLQSNLVFTEVKQACIEELEILDASMYGTIDGFNGGKPFLKNMQTKDVSYIIRNRIDELNNNG